MRKCLNKKDIIIILGIFAVSSIVWAVYSFSALNGKGIYAEITFDGETVRNIPLKYDAVFSIEQLPNVVFEVKDGTIAFIESDCPDKICVRTGYINSGFAACLPNKVVVTIIDTDSIIDSAAN